MRALEREAKTQRDLLESYMGKYREASARDSINAAPPEARIISRATPALAPAYPKKTATLQSSPLPPLRSRLAYVVTGALLGEPSEDTRRPSMAATCPRLTPLPGTQADADAGRSNAAAAPVSATAHARERVVAGPSLTPPMGLRLPPTQPALALVPVASLDSVAGALREGGDRCVAVLGDGTQCGHELYGHHARPRARAGGERRACRSRARRAEPVGDFERSGRARHRRTGARPCVFCRHHHARSGFARSHRVATGQVGQDARTIMSSEMLTHRDRGAGAKLRSYRARPRSRAGNSARSDRHVGAAGLFWSQPIRPHRACAPSATSL